MINRKFLKAASKLLATCFITMSIMPYIPAYASELDAYSGTDNMEIATSSNARKVEEPQASKLIIQNNPSNNEIQEWLDNTQDPTDITLPFTLKGVKYLDDGNATPVQEQYSLDGEDASGFEFKVLIRDLEGNKIVEDTVLSDEEKINYETYDINLNQIYRVDVSEIPDTKDCDDKVYQYDDSVYTFYLLATTYDVMDQIYGTMPSSVANDPEYVIAVKEYEWSGWFESDYDDDAKIWYLDYVDFYNRVREAVKFRFEGEKRFTINDKIADPSKFEFKIEKMQANQDKFSVDYKIEKANNGIDNNKIESDEVSCDKDGAIDYPIYKIPKVQYEESYFCIYESTKQPSDTSTHMYDYDDTVYEYIVAWIDEIEEYGMIEEYEPALYYGIITDDGISDPIKAELDDDGIYVIPDNDFTNKEYVQGAGVKLSGQVDYKINGEKADASAFQYRLTGWPGTNGYIDLVCDEDGNIQFPDSMFIGFDAETNNTITVFQTTKQPDDTENVIYSYDPSVYQFRLAFVTKEMAVSYGIDETKLSEIDADYVLVYKDYKDLIWKMADLIDGDFVISDIDFTNRCDNKETDRYTVQFNTNGGGCLPAYTDIKKGNRIDKPSSPIKEGYEFVGWFKDKDLSTEWDFESDTVTSNIVLYAKWNKKESSGNNSTINGSSSGGGGSHSSSGSVSVVKDPGWFKNNGIWYYKDYKTNALKKGWHLDPDDNYWYYLDLNDGHMYIGWNQIDGKWYYFNPEELAPNQTWFINSNGRWYYNNTNKTKPFGSMYANENTPDGFRVNEKGEWAQ